MAAFRTLAKSRYGIKLHKNNDRVTFLLAGPTKEDRQNLYRRITEAIARLKSLNSVDYNINGDIWQDVQLDMFDFDLRVVDGDRVVIDATPKNNEQGELLRTAFNITDTFSIGVVPHESGFSQAVLELWNGFTQNQKIENLKITGFQFNAWDGDTILVRMSLYIGTDAQVNTQAQGIPVQRITRPAVNEEVEAAGDNSTLVGGIPPNFELKFPFTHELNGDWQRVREVLFAQVGSLYLIKQLSKGVECDTFVSEQAEPERGVLAA